MDTFTGREAADRFLRRLQAPLDPGHQSAVARLAETVDGPVAMISAFRRFRETNRPPDGGRSGAVPVVAAAGPLGVSWVTATSRGRSLLRTAAPAAGFDAYDGFDVVTFNIAEVMFEGGPAGDVTFGTAYDVTTVEGEYMRALEFVLACAEFGYGGRAKASDSIPPTAHNISDARAALGIG